MKPSRDPQRLVEIMATLRTPVTGCPWDLEQSFRSIVPYTVEEVYEVVDAIERGDMENLREELGDLLLQVVYHAQMAAETGAFTFADVVEGITAKMIRRHPHVFGDEQARSAGSAKGMWEAIKAQEKAERAERRAAMDLPAEAASDGLLDKVPAAFEPMLEAEKLQRQAAKVGFDWNDPRAVLAKLREEVDELEAELDRGSREAIEDELGDVLFTVVNMARHFDLDSGSALRRTNGKFRSRFAAMETAAGERGEELDDMSLDALEDLWVQAKRAP